MGVLVYQRYMTYFDLPERSSAVISPSQQCTVFIHDGLINLRTLWNGFISSFFCCCFFIFFTSFNWKCLSQGSKPGVLPSHYLPAMIICRYFMQSDVLSVNSIWIYSVWIFFIGFKSCKFTRTRNKILKRQIVWIPNIGYQLSFSVNGSWLTASIVH